MRTFSKMLLSMVAVGLLSLSAQAAKVKLDKATGLKIAPGMDVVIANCTVCHSAKFITLQKGDRDTWLQMIRWMQRTQGLWDFDPKTEDIILTYLEKNYPPGKASRRPNLKPKDMPALQQ
jgi:hypothetical protein